MVEIYKSILESLAVGDALGMPTEFMSREKIKKEFGLVDHLIDPKLSIIHKELNFAQITDDTEQNLYLIKAYCEDGKISVENTVAALMKWIDEKKAIELGYIGPSSKRALNEISEGVSPEIAGKGGTTCGAPMRVISAALCSSGDYKNLENNIYNCTVPTHNTNLAMESAFCIGFALKAAIDGLSFNEIIKKSFKGAVIGRKKSSYDYIGASCREKAEVLIKEIEKSKAIEEVLNKIYYLNGTTMEANEITAAVLGIFSYAKKDVWKAITLGASVGGDTDTIAAIVGVLCCAYAKKHNIPSEILNKVIESNNLNLDEYAELISEK